MMANSYSTPGTTGGNREDLRNILTILEPEETPFTSMVKKGDAPSAVLVEVLADNLRKPRINGTKEGQDAGKGNNKAKNRTRFGAYVHRIQDEFGVTDVQQAISQRGGTAAVESEYGNSKAKTIREMKRDIEAIACANQDTQGGSDADMQTRGAFSWVQAAAQSTQPVPALFRPTGGDPLATTSTILVHGTTAPPCFTEAQLNAVLKNLSKVYGGKREYQCIAGDNVTETIDNFSRVNSLAVNSRYMVNDNASTHTITLSVQVFDSSFGQINVIPTQFNMVSGTTGDGDANAALILNMNLWQMLFLENLHAVDQEENAGGESGYAKAMFSLLCLNPKGNGKLVTS